jgi:predicted transposase/invertase (TIGR01784 family)
MARNNQLISFDYAIKYLLRDKRDFSIVEGFISTLLRTQSYNSVKITALLDSASNREEPYIKKSLADMIVEDEHQNKYIIEIERSVDKSFIHKSLFNTSRLIVDNLPKGSEYLDIKKVFHISLLYFPIGTSSLYHGKTIFHSLDTKDKLSYEIVYQPTGKVFNAVDILPEYFLISIPQFNNTLVKEIDEWLYFMKNDEIPKNSHSPYMKQIAEKLRVLKMTGEERNAYYAYNKYLTSEISKYDSAVSVGEEKKSIEIAKKLLSKNFDIHTISEATGLSVEKLKTL